MVGGMRVNNYRRSWFTISIAFIFLITFLAGCGPKDLVSLANLSGEDLSISDKYGNTVRLLNADEFINAFKKAEVAPNANAAKSETNADYVFRSGGNKVYYDADGKYLIFVDANQKKTVYSADLSGLIAGVRGLPPTVKEGTNLDPDLSPIFSDISRVKEPVAAQYDLDNKTLLMVAAGEKSTGGYTMKVDDVAVGTDGALVITVRVDEPAGNATQALTYPYLEILIPETNLDVDVRLVTTGPTGDNIEHVNLAVVEPEQNVILFKPERGALLTERVTMFGFARVFEGAFTVEVEDGHYILGRKNVQAEEGAPGWGYFEFTMDLQQASSPHGMIIVSTTSAKDGSRVEELIVPVAFGGK
jgi:hypothetical protein